MTMQAQLLKQSNAATNNVYSLEAKQKKPAQTIAAAQVKNQVPPQYLQSKAGLLLVILAHASLIFWLLQQAQTPVIKINQAKSMMVSLIAPAKIEPAPMSEMAQIMEPPKPVINEKIKAESELKKVVETIKPIEAPAERLVEASAESNNEQQITALQAAPVLESMQAAVAQKNEPVVEDVIEPPRFGVSYLNNPAPDYPAMSRRAGEEGRVLMKVLVSAEGGAEDVQIEKSSGSDRLDNAAINAVKKWQFIPAKKNNQPLSAYVLVPIKFSLNS
jgi:periplasmic protein TonB